MLGWAHARKIHACIGTFSKEAANASYARERTFVQGNEPGRYAPLKFLSKKIDDLGGVDGLLRAGMVYDSLAPFLDGAFTDWYQDHFSQKPTPKVLRNISVLHEPNVKLMVDSIDMVNKSYSILRREHIVTNGKNLPVQLGEWYAKSIFGLEQRKSTSQRGFDFFLKDSKVEVKVHWSERPLVKGLKVRKSLVDLSEYTIIVYLAKDLKIKEICFFDSGFIMRKFADKGHTIFLKDEDISHYFFSRSSKHIDKVVNRSLLVRFSSSHFAMQLSEYF